MLLDIEGTTTPITFVHDVLFPYIREHLAEYLSDHWEDSECQQDVEALRQQAKLDSEMKGVVTIPASGANKEDIKQSVVDSVNWLMDADRKCTALKQLQGHMWLGGYREGTLMGQVYEDVVAIMEQWKRARKDICIYSSGSVAAQKLLFGYSTYGDLLYLFSNHFDTKIGMKTECESYRKIAKDLQCEPQDIMFLTDVVREARPACEAGLSVAIVIRPGNAPISDEEAAEFPTIKSFTELQPQNSYKR